MNSIYMILVLDPFGLVPRTRDLMLPRLSVENPTQDLSAISIAGSSSWPQSLKPIRLDLLSSSGIILRAQRRIRPDNFSPSPTFFIEVDH